MIAAHPLRSYQRIATQTAPPGQLVLMLYEGAIRFLERALAGFEHDDPLEHNSTINNNILRAQQIISELRRSLDLEQGGELASRLQGLYGYMDRQLMTSNLKKSPDGIHDTLGRLTTLRNAWSEMLGQQEPAPLGREALALAVNS